MTTTTLQTSTGATIYQASATTNFNHASNSPLILGENNGAANAAGRWLLSFAGLTDGTIPHNDRIVSATLSINPSADLADNASTLSVFRQLRAWVPSQATWNIYSTGNNWQTAGGFGANDCEQTAIGSVSLTATETLNAFKNITLSSTAIQEIVSGAWSVNSFLLKPDTELNNAYTYKTQFDGTAGNRPKLVIVHEPVTFFF